MQGGSACLGRPQTTSSDTWRSADACLTRTPLYRGPLLLSAQEVETRADYLRMLSSTEYQ